jgi:oxygen-independent coproporphyrinogen-3 oxidase
MLNPKSVPYIERAKAMVKTFAPEELEKLGLIPMHENYSPSIHYPPIYAYPPMTEEEYFKDIKTSQDGLFVIYAHIPFCINRCTFCHFAVCVGASSEEKDAYLSALEKEMDTHMKRLGVGKLRARSILVGGGTPTDISCEQLERFLRSFTSRIDMSSCSQFSYDVDPTTLLGDEGLKKLKIMRSFGVDRITIGIQSFKDDVLARMNRAHDSKEAVQAVEQGRKAGLEDICIELIYGYPGDTVESWIDDMEKAVTLGVEEIQVYRLRVKPYGPHVGAIMRQHEKGHEGFTEVKNIRLMKALGTVIAADNGYKESLTRVFSRDPKYISRYGQDFSCFLHDLIGLGLSSWSGHARTMGWNVREDIKEYQALANAGKVPIVEGRVRTDDEEKRRSIVMPMKCWGKVIKKVYKNRTGSLPEDFFGDKIGKLVKHALITNDADKLELTPRGRFFADEVCEFFYRPEYLPFSEEMYAKGELDPHNN